MESALTTFPNTKALAAGLGCVFRPRELPARESHILRREANLCARTFPSEIVIYRREDGSEVELFCKYMFGLTDDHSGSRGGVAYEAKVYERILRFSGLTIPAYHGTYQDVATGSVWLIIQHLDNCLELQKVPQAMQQAAAWIGRFHAAQEKNLAAAPLRFLAIYDADYYQHCARRTAALAGPWRRRVPWLQDLCARFEEVIGMLLAALPTVIHGDYHPPNILFHDGAVYPVDWELAAVAAGEIDLAYLIEGWAQDVVDDCTCAYRQARWPRGTPAEFEDRMASARLFRSLRTLGEQPEWPANQNTFWQIEELARMGKVLGLIDGEPALDW